MKTGLVKLASGSIDLSVEAGLMMLQFNASCTDALPYCHGMCCKLQLLYSAELTDAEATDMGCRVLPDDRLVMPTKVDNPNECNYLEGDLCGLHEVGQKPHGCKRWHCSPGGNPGDAEIEVRAKGWVLVPTQK